MPSMQMYILNIRTAARFLEMSAISNDIICMVNKHESKMTTDSTKISREDVSSLTVSTMSASIEAEWRIYASVY